MSYIFILHTKFIGFCPTSRSHPFCFISAIVFKYDFHHVFCILDFTIKDSHCSIHINSEVTLTCAISITCFHLNVLARHINIEYITLLNIAVRIMEFSCRSTIFLEACWWLTEIVSSGYFSNDDNSPPLVTHTILILIIWINISLLPVIFYFFLEVIDNLCKVH